MTALIHSFQSEWLKKKRSLAVWLVLVGSVFTPGITILIALNQRTKLVEQYAADTFWSKWFNQCWQPMAFMLLPLGIILATSLIAQLEFKNNTWKQVHASPQPLSTIFIAKFSVQLVMMLQLFILFNLFTYLSAWVPPLLLSEVPFPTAEIDWATLIQSNVNMFVDCLPIVALQFLLSIQFRNFLVAVGAGMVIWLAGTLGLSWKHSYAFPYLYTAFEQIVLQGGKLGEQMPNIHLMAIGYFGVFMVSAYILYVRKDDRG